MLSSRASARSRNLLPSPRRLRCNVQRLLLLVLLSVVLMVGNLVLYRGWDEMPAEASESSLAASRPSPSLSHSSPSSSYASSLLPRFLKNRPASPASVSDAEKSDAEGARGRPTASAPAPAPAPSQSQRSPKPQHPESPSGSLAPLVAPATLTDFRSLPLTRRSTWSQLAEPGDVCTAQFGNGFNTYTDFCQAGSSSGVRCHYSDRLRTSVCEALDVMLDTSKVHVVKGNEDIAEVRGREEDHEFPTYSHGAFAVNCEASEQGQQARRDGKLKNHLVKMFDSIAYNRSSVHSKPSSSSSSSSSSDGCQHWIRRPALFVTRYEYANLYHTMNDWYNVYQARQMFGGEAMHVVLFDGHSKGALDEGWSKLFDVDMFDGNRATHDGQHKEHVDKRARLFYVKHLPDYFASSSSSTAASDVRVCFSRAIFVHPAYQCALGVDMMSDDATAEQCSRQLLKTETGPAANATSGLLGRGGHGQLRTAPMLDFIHHFARAFDAEKSLMRLSDTNDNDEDEDDGAVRVSIVFRRDYLAHPRLAVIRASRKIGNEQALLDAANSVEGVRARGVVLTDLSLAEQVRLMTKTDVLVGVHGAGLSYSLLLPRALHLSSSSSSADPPHARGGARSVLLEWLPSGYMRPHFRFFAAWAGHEYQALPVRDSSDTMININPAEFQSVLERRVQALVQAKAKAKQK